MGDPFDEEMEVPAAVECILEAPLPASVEGMLSQICREQNQEAPDVWIRRRMGSIGEQGSLAILKIIASRPIKKTLSAFLLHMIDRYPACLSSSPFTTPQKRTSPSLLPTPGSEGKRVKGASSSEQFLARPQSASPKKVYRQLNLSFGNEPLSICKRKTSDTISQQLMVLSELEFRKLFLVLSYIGSNNLEDVISPQIADDIIRKKHLPMTLFESEIWDALGKQCYAEPDRSKYLDWDCRKTHLYYCHIKQNGCCTFKGALLAFEELLHTEIQMKKKLQTQAGPYLSTTRTHLQRALGDDNV